MAKVWKVSDEVQRGDPVKILPWERCRDLLELDDLCRTEDRPKFDGKGSLGLFTTHVVVSLDQDEAEAHGIEPGYFLSPLDPHTALDRIGAADT